MKYIAEEGYVYDYAEPRYIEDEDGNQLEQHLYAKVLFLSSLDSIDNYKLVKLEEAE